MRPRSTRISRSHTLTSYPPSRRKAARATSRLGADESSPLVHKHASASAPAPRPLLPAWIQYPLLTLLIVLAGFGAWYIQNVYAPGGRANHGAGGPVPLPPRSSHGGAHKSHGLLALLSRGPAAPPPEPVALEWKSQLLGWSSAVLYLGSRVPQIAHNMHTRCAGLSLAMFFFSISGSESGCRGAGRGKWKGLTRYVNAADVTYVASILFKSVERTYIIANASWLAGGFPSCARADERAPRADAGLVSLALPGSGLTVFLDIFVLGQFAYYSWQDSKAAEAALDRDEA